MNEHIAESYSGFGPSNEYGLIKKISGSNSLNSENCTLHVKPLLDIVEMIIAHGLNDSLGYKKVTLQTPWSKTNICYM